MNKKLNNEYKNLIQKYFSIKVINTDLESLIGKLINSIKDKNSYPELKALKKFDKEEEMQEELFYPYERVYLLEDLQNNLLKRWLDKLNGKWIVYEYAKSIKLQDMTIVRPLYRDTCSLGIEPLWDLYY